MIVINMQMQINLKDNIVILDEAHNIEDKCREVAGVSLRDSDLAVAAKECLDLSYQRRVHHDIYKDIHTYLLDIVKFLKGVIVEENTNVRT